jgi:hypothetical protein
LLENLIAKGEALLSLAFFVLSQSKLQGPKPKTENPGLRLWTLDLGLRNPIDQIAELN